MTIATYKERTWNLELRLLLSSSNLLIIDCGKLGLESKILKKLKLIFFFICIYLFLTLAVFIRLSKGVGNEETEEQN